MTEKKVCWNYDEYSCQYPCSLPNPDCHWIIQAQYSKRNTPSSLTKIIYIEENKK